MRRLLRRLVTAIASGLAIVVLYPVTSEFFIELAREWGWYEKPSHRLDVAMSAFSSFVSETWFFATTTFFVGLAVGMWVDTFLRRREGSQADQHSRNDFDKTTQQLLVKELSKFNDGTYNVKIQVSNATQLPFAKAIEPCFRNAGWQTHIDPRPQELIGGEYWRDMRIEGFNRQLIPLIQAALAKAGLHTHWPPTRKENKVSRNSPWWSLVEHRIRLKIGHE